MKNKRNISFNKIIRAIRKGAVINIINHPDQNRYPDQKIYLIKIKQYIVCVPFIKDEEKIFLKTIFPSRKYTKKYLKEKES